ncbi:CoF synthetase [Phaeobacter sp. HF9A]|uniref:CoF synthetase n=1 Tax=Phaeobacter sp. HF9A TaxID=2721561 RepID=UPI0014317CC0|nr:CoF synthetase [Phaeobacter sp. HF9A]NIZ12519.1 CoF synthetase [Phaeobacter sp. HF9A]
MRAALETASAFVTATRMARPGLSRAAFDHWQHRMLRRWLARDVRGVRAYQGGATELQDLPIRDKATLMADFAAYNRAGISADQAWQAIGDTCRIGDFTVGASTGTSGNRGVFVISEPERYRWLGTVLAKTMGGLWGRRQRVAIILPQDTRLYDSARSLPLMQLRFFDLRSGPENWRTELEAFDPSVLIAPPKLLRHVAQQQFRLRPQRIFSAAETLDPMDRSVIETCFGQALEQIYMATEGLLAVTCRQGGLHLAEESMFFEFEPAGNGLVNPVISSFRRQTQILARYRMNDLLRLAERPCACGSPLRLVEEVVGRVDDCFHLTGAAGPVFLTPDVLRNAILDSDRRITDFRLIQVAVDEIELRLTTDLPDEAAQAAATAVDQLLACRQATCRITQKRATLTFDPSRKLRRVECRLGPDMRWAAR